MLELINAFFHANILASMGLFLTVVFLGSKVLRRFGVPQVVDFIIMGLLQPTFRTLNREKIAIFDRGSEQVQHGQVLGW